MKEKTVDLNPKELESILLNYYSEKYQGEDIKIIYEPKCASIEPYGEKVLFTDIYLKRNNMIEKIEISDMEKVFESYTQISEFDLDGIELKTIDVYKEGFYDYYKTFEFEGITLNLKKSVKCKQKKRVTCNQ